MPQIRLVCVEARRLGGKRLDRGFDRVEFAVGRIACGFEFGKRSLEPRGFGAFFLQCRAQDSEAFAKIPVGATGAVQSEVLQAPCSSAAGSPGLESGLPIPESDGQL